MAVKNDMHYNTLGKTALTVSAIGLGCSRFGSMMAATGRSDLLRMVDIAVGEGINFFDTADIYGQGDSERILGASFRGRRDRAIIVSKAGQKFKSPHRAMIVAKPILRQLIRRSSWLQRCAARTRGETLERCFEPDYLRMSIEGSLRRLHTDYLDIFLLHSPSVEVVKRSDCFEMLERLKAKGYLRFWGVSCDDTDVAHAALDHAGPGGVGMDVIQLPFYRGCDPRTLDTLTRASALGTGVIAREALRGLAARNTSDPTVDPNIVRMIRFVIDHPAVSTLLTGTTSARHLVANIAAASARTTNEACA